MAVWSTLDLLEQRNKPPSERRMIAAKLFVLCRSLARGAERSLLETLPRAAGAINSACGGWWLVVNACCCCVTVLLLSYYNML